MADTPPTRPRPANWLRVFLPFAFGYYLSYLLRNANAVLAPELTRELSLSAADLGLLTSTYFFAFGAFQIPLGILLDRYGPRRVEATLLLFAAGGTLVFAWGHNIGELAVGRGLIGLGVSACLMAGLKNFSQWYPAERQSSLTGAIMAAGGLGMITASIPMEMLLPVLGWRGVFVLLTAILVAAAAFLFVAVPDRQDGIAKSTMKEQWQGVAHIFKSRDFWRFAPLMTLFSGGFMAVQGLWAVPWFLNVDGLTRDGAAQHLFAMAVASLTSFFAMAAFSTKLIRCGVKPAALMGGLLAVAWVCLVMITTRIGPQLPLWAMSSFCASTVTLGYAALGGHFAPALYGRVSTALNLAAFVGAFSLQWGLGVLIDLFVAANWSKPNAFRAAFAVMATLQLLSWVWFVVAGRRQAALRTSPAHVRPTP